MSSSGSTPTTRPDTPPAATSLAEIKQRLREVLPDLRDRYAVEHLALHGSWVRCEARPDSDVDVLVDFEDSEAGRAVSLLDFIALQQELEDRLGMPVDLGERSALEGPARENILRTSEPVE